MSGPVCFPETFPDEGGVMIYRAMLICSLLLLTDCAKAGQDDWSNIDYARIARENYRRENDASYTPPVVTGCVDDDLINCPVGQPYYR